MARISIDSLDPGCTSAHDERQKEEIKQRKVNSLVEGGIFSTSGIFALFNSNGA